MRIASWVVENIKSNFLYKNIQEACSFYTRYKMEVAWTGWIHHCGKYCVRVCKLPSAHTQELQSLCDLTLQISPHPDTDILTHIDISMTMAAHCVKSFTLQCHFWEGRNLLCALPFSSWLDLADNNSDRDRWDYGDQCTLHTPVTPGVRWPLVVTPQGQL